MFLAIATLLFQVSAVPQNVTSAATAAAIQSAQAESTRTVSSTPTLSSRAPMGLSGDVVSQPVSGAAYTSGHFAAEPMAPINGLLVASASTPSSPVVSAPVAGAFVAPVHFSSALSPAQIRSERNRRCLWLSLAIAQYGAATFDAASTRHVIATGQGVEDNPLIRPFAGNASLYAAIQVGPIVLDYLGHRMMTSENSWARHTWWIPQAVGTAMSIFSGVHNLGVHSAP